MGLQPNQNAPAAKAPAATGAPIGLPTFMLGAKPGHPLSVTSAKDMNVQFWSRLANATFWMYALFLAQSAGAMAEVLGYKVFDIQTWLIVLSLEFAVHSALFAYTTYQSHKGAHASPHRNPFVKMQQQLWVTYTVMVTLVAPFFFIYEDEIDYLDQRDLEKLLPSSSSLDARIQVSWMIIMGVHVALLAQLINSAIPAWYNMEADHFIKTVLKNSPGNSAAMEEAIRLNKANEHGHAVADWNADEDGETEGDTAERGGFDASTEGYKRRFNAMQGLGTGARVRTGRMNL